MQNIQNETDTDKKNCYNGREIFFLENNEWAYTYIKEVRICN